MIAANAGVGKPWAHHATGILGGLLAGATFLFGAIDIAAASSGPHNPTAVDVGIMVTALLAALLAAKPVRERVARVLPMDPDNPVHALALVLAVILLGTQVSSIAFSDVLAADLKLPALTVADLIWQEAPFLILAAVGVGIYLRRDLLSATTRLGLVRPQPWHLVLALAAAGLFYGMGAASQYLGQSLTPGLAEQVTRTDQHLFGGLNNWYGIIALALVPGICEEVLFRGALQPRFGIITTAVLFAAIHTEYGFSIDVVTIFLIAIGLGFIRRYANTTACCVCHATYNLVSGTGLPGITLWIAIGVEVVLVAIALYLMLARRRASESPMAEDARLG